MKLLTEESHYKELAYKEFSVSMSFIMHDTFLTLEQIASCLKRKFLESSDKSGENSCSRKGSPSKKKKHVNIAADLRRYFSQHIFNNPFDWTLFQVMRFPCKQARKHARISCQHTHICCSRRPCWLAKLRRRQWKQETPSATEMKISETVTYIYQVHEEWENIAKNWGRTYVHEYL